ncbi:helix-turn-helix transcriptional regulator [Alkalihalophilus marmarensis]|uniref:helix-turn-helix domain-containing protein n=1 Tax=Alkalihalophilus marmarensis TaxID=521377 RepID=UPI00203E79E4|nr:helix-turn-helix domain-containing protein [Alkalihalophilus marmarensis]MCM3489976.1 helix-turn-helix transcriptional regulator [Alkalihalophilus marmarensis]
MDYKIGQKLKELRKYFQLTQGELAKGICTQAMISKIEKNDDIYPSAQLLYQLSERLGVSIEYFFSEEDLPNISYVNEVCDQLTELIRSKQYQEAYKMIKLEKKNPSFINKPHLRRFIMWREAICLNYLFDDKQEALVLLDEALTYSNTSVKNYSLQELDILTSKAIILGEMKEWTQADDLFSQIINNIRKIPLQKDKTTLINVYYNASRTAIKLHMYKKALRLCEEGIKVCKKEKTLFLLGYLYYQKAECHSAVNASNSEMIESYYNKALLAFEQSDDHHNYKLVAQKINSLEELKTHID